MDLQKALSYLEIYNEGQDYFKYDNLEYDNLEDTLQLGVFNFCGCGYLKDNLQYIKNGLHFIRNFHLTTWDGNDENCSFFGNEQAYNFFLYWCDNNSLILHGSSVHTSWLSSKGEAVLTLLNEIDV